jgi:PAS domain S-box-containing protein
MHKILVVDDEAIISTQLEESLSAIGYDVVGTAADGEEAVKLATDLKPDLVLMDIMMPGKLDGIAASERIKSELEIPVIFLTAYVDDKLVNKARNTEPYGYLTKPFKQKELKACIEIAVYKKQIEQRLRESERRYRSVVDTATDAIVTFNGEGNIVSWNEAASTIFGYPPDEALNRSFTIIMDEEMAEEFKSRMSQMVKTGISSVIGRMVEGQGNRKDGSVFPMEFAVTSWEIATGIFFTIIARDISERVESQKKLKSALKEREALLQELNSRVTNNLAVISSIFLLQTEYLDNEQAVETLEKSQNRIKAMKLIHEHMYRNQDLTKIDAVAFAKDLTERLYKSLQIDRTKIDWFIHTDRFFLDLDRAVPCGLILNELISNSLQHAFPNGKSGLLSINFKTEKFLNSIIVSDNGIGLPDSPHFQGFGLKLVSTLAKQIDAIVEVSRDSGTTVKLILK